MASNTSAGSGARSFIRNFRFSPGSLAAVLLTVALGACAGTIGRGGGGASTLSPGKGSSELNATGSDGASGAPGAVPGQASSPGSDRGAINQPGGATRAGTGAGSATTSMTPGGEGGAINQSGGTTRAGAGADGATTRAGAGQDGGAIDQPGGATRAGAGAGGVNTQVGAGEQGGAVGQPGGTTRAGAGAGGTTTRGGMGDDGGLNADGTSSGGGATGHPGGTTRAGAGAGGATTRAGDGTDESEQLAAGTIGAPASRAKVEEEVTAQTLNGLLPLVVGVDEEGQFDFDQAVLRPEVKVRLDELAAKLDGAQFDRLDIVGYADPIGTEEYNQQLSERRAWAVARYLLDKSVPLKKMKVEGRGQRNSLVPEGSCSGLNKSEMIACVQKDRRVEIEASIRKTNVKVQ